MAALTRILNNQIYNSTIIAYQKIAAGTITGSLFASNVTVPGDLLIAGNLFVLGSSSYTTIASTNTYVNDPLVVMNNGFSGTNTYDEGLIFNRGTSQNQAIIWSEAFGEFRLIATNETGTTYGNITAAGLARLSIGSLNVPGQANVGIIFTTGNIVSGGDVTVNGGDILTNQTTFNLLNATATTLNIGGVAATLALGATTGTTTINNPTVVGSQTTQALYNTVATTLNFAGAATTFNIGATTGTLTVNNPTVVGSQSSQNLYNTTATTLNFGGAATTLVVGATSGVAHLRNANIWLPNATSIDGAQADITVLSQTATNANVLIKANVILGANVGTTTIQNPTLVGTQTTQNVYNTIATTVNAFGAATTLTVGATTGTLTLRNATITTPGQIISTRAGSAADAGGQIYLNGATSNRIDWVAAGTGAPAFTTRSSGTKINLYPQESASAVDYAIGIDISTLWSSVPSNDTSFNFKWYGGETLVANISGIGNFTTVGDAAINGGDLTTTATTFNLLNAAATTVNFAGATTDLTIGATSGTANIRVGNVNFNNATTFYAQQPAIALFNSPAIVNAFTGATTANIATSATWLNIGATSGTINVQNPNVYGTQATQNLYTSANTTTMNFATSSTNLNIGSTAGTANILLSNISFPNATTFSASQASIGVFNTPTTVTAFNAATSITIGAATGNTIVRTADTFFQGVANVNATRDATTTTSAALTVAGGAAVKAGMIVGGTLFANASAGSTQQNSGIGAIVIPTGGISVGGTANIAGYTQINGATQLNNTLTVGGISYYTNTTNATEATGSSGALQIKGGASIAKDLHVGGNIYASNIFGTSYQIITVQDPLLYLDAANTFPYNYDIGFYSNFVGPNPIDDTGNVYQHTGVVRDDTDNTWKFFSNVRSEPSGASITFDVNTIYDPVKAGNLTLTYTQAATSTTTGALQVAGGAGIVGTLVAGQINSTGNVLGQAGTFNALTVNGNESVTGYLNVTGNVMTASLSTGQINTTGNVLATAGIFNALTVNGNESVTGYLNVTGNVMASAGTLNGLTVNGATTQAGTLTVSSGFINSSGNVLATAGTFNGLTVNGNESVTGYLNVTGNVMAAVVTASQFNTPGNIISTGAIHNSLTVNGNGSVTGYLNVTGNVLTTRLDTGALGATGIIWANASVVTNATGVGALVIPNGGASIQGNIIVGQNIFAGPLAYENASGLQQVIFGGADAGPTYVQAALLNLDNRGSTDLALYSSNGNDGAGWADIGFTGNAFADTSYTITKPNDGYFFVKPSTNNGGNLVLATSEIGVYNDVIIAVGSFESSAEVARFHGNVGTSGNAWIKYQTVSTTPNNGALRVDGGVGIRGNIRIGGGAVINNSQTADPFQVKGVATTSLIYADTAYGAVILGGSNITTPIGSTLKVGGTDSILLPIGTTG